MHFGVTINFRRTGKQDTGSYTLGKSEHVERPHGTCFNGFDGIVLVMRRRCWTSQMINLVHFQLNWFRHIVDNNTVSQDM